MTKQKRIYVPVSDEVFEQIKAIAKSSKLSEAYISMRMLQRGFDEVVNEANSSYGLKHDENPISFNASIKVKGHLHEG